MLKKKEVANSMLFRGLRLPQCVYPMTRRDKSDSPKENWSLQRAFFRLIPRRSQMTWSLHLMVSPPVFPMWTNIMVLLVYRDALDDDDDCEFDPTTTEDSCSSALLSVLRAREMAVQDQAMVNTTKRAKIVVSLTAFLILIADLHHSLLHCKWMQLWWRCDGVMVWWDDGVMGWWGDGVIARVEWRQVIVVKVFVFVVFVLRFVSA
jgi:hypothetical protein